MNRTENVSIGRRGFVCEQDAYKLLQEYLARSAKALKDDPDQMEILADLEQSLASHLHEMSGDLVVDHRTAEQVIGLMGEVDPVSSDESVDERIETETDNNHPEEYDFVDRLKSLFRKPLHKDHDRQIADGVCAGIAKALSVDPIWIRLLFIVLTFMTQGAMIAIYIILSIIMKDEPGYTKKTAGQVIGDIRDKVEGSLHERRSYEKVLRGIVVVFAKIIWWILRLSVGLVLLVLAMTWGSALVFMLSNAESSSLFGSSPGISEYGLVISIGLVLLIPLFELLTAMIPGTRPKKSGIVLAGWSVWVLAIVAAVGFGTNVSPKLYDNLVTNEPQNKYIYVESNDGRIENFCLSPFGTCGDTETFTSRINLCDADMTIFMEDDQQEWLRRGWIYYEPHDTLIKTQEQYCESVKSVTEEYASDAVMLSENSFADMMSLPLDTSEEPDERVYIKYLVFRDKPKSL